jgi:hypothetical protein
MDETKNVGGTDRLVRILLTVVLSIVAVRSLRRGKRLRGALASAGALVLGFTATTRHCGVNDALDVDTTGDSDDVDIEFDETDASADGAVGDSDAEATQVREHYLYCAACGEPIVAGQSRGPNSEGDVVHDDCA